MSKNTTVIEMSPQGSRNRDDYALARVGKKPVLKRNFGSVTILGFSCTVLITWESALQVFLLGLQNGGPGAIIYGFIVVWIGTLSVFATMSELVSMAPTSSGQQHWVAMLAPPAWRRVLSYITGWLTICGWQSLVASGAYITSTLIQGVMVITRPSYLGEWKNWHGTLLYWAVLLICVFINTTVAKWLPKFEGLLLILHILGFFGVIIPLIVLSEHTSSEYVFKTFTYDGGWSSHGLAFCIGMLGNVFAFAGGDAAIHMVEEIHNAQVVVPRSILISILINGTLGLSMLIAVLYCISDLELALATSPMYPIMSIFEQAVGSVAGAATMSSVIVVMSFSATTGVMASASRVLWAFARDHGLPGWRALEKVDHRTGIPLNSVAVTSIVACVLATVNIGDPAAFNGVISLTIAALFSSYLLAASLLLYRRLKGHITEPDTFEGNVDLSNTIGRKLTWGPWRLRGLFGLANNIFSCCYLTFILFFSFWPARTPVTPQNMNWAILVTVVVVSFSSTYYLVWARKTYTGPIVDVF